MHSAASLINHQLTQEIPPMWHLSRSIFLKKKVFFSQLPQKSGSWEKNYFPTPLLYFPTPLQKTSVHFLNNPFYYCYLLEASILLSFFAKIFARSTQHHFIPLLTSYDHQKRQLIINQNKNSNIVQFIPTQGPPINFISKYCVYAPQYTSSYSASSMKSCPTRSNSTLRRFTNSKDDAAIGCRLHSAC